MEKCIKYRGKYFVMIFQLLVCEFLKRQDLKGNPLRDAIK